MRVLHAAAARRVPRVPLPAGVGVAGALDGWLPRPAAVARRSASSSAAAAGKSAPGGGGGRSSLRERNMNFLAWTMAVALGTVAMSYAAVPLYQMFCQATGFGGTVQTATPTGAASQLPGGGGGSGDGANSDNDASASASSSSSSSSASPSSSSRAEAERRAKMRIDAGKRPVKVRFNADVSAAMPWRFVPRQTELVVQPGETALAFYTAHNRTDDDVVGIATYNVTPPKVGIYFNKIQCFCFEEQRLRAREKIDMPVFFFVDREFAEDPRMADVDSITLSYTFFRSEDVSPEFLQQQQAQVFSVR